MKIISASDTVKNYTVLERQVNSSEWLLMNFGARKEPSLLDFHSLPGLKHRTGLTLLCVVVLWAGATPQVTPVGHGEHS